MSNAVDSPVSKKSGSSRNGVNPSSPSAEPVKQQQLPATTFVQANVLNFREVVQKHTGAGDDIQEKLPVTMPLKQSGKQDLNRKQENGSKDLVRRQPSYKVKQNLRKLEIKQINSPFKRPGSSPRTGETISPTVYDHLPALLPSPVTPLSNLTLDTPPTTPTEVYNPPNPRILDEEKTGSVMDRFPFLHASSLQKFPFLHPPLHRRSEPELLDLFPVHSPRLRPDKE